MSDFVSEPAVNDAKQTLKRLKEAMELTIKGKPEVIDHVLICLAAGGHALIEDLPGVGKTTLAYSLARSMDCSFSRIQFTSDLLPSDVTGVSIYDERERRFIFNKGPIFSNVVLADEINRATPKTQSALLEVMDRAKVTVDGAPHEVGKPFMVFATQNPVDYEGTFPLPESQMDRFLMRLHIGYPKAEDELTILRSARNAYDDIQRAPVVSHAEVLNLQTVCLKIFTEDTVLAYILSIIGATRTEAEFKAGVSVRGSLALKHAAQGRALLHGRDFVIPEDVQEMTIPVLAHRLSPVRPSADPLEERRAISTALRRILNHLTPPA
jgi:MoxR-like ATPase